MDRSEIMRRVRSSNTSAEMSVRRHLFSLGYRYRLHRRDLPGKPDIVFPGKKSVIFVHGCFWHGHSCKRGARIPKTNTDYWTGKIQRNIERDASNARTLKDMGWKVLVVWECEIKEKSQLIKKLIRFLS